MSDRPEPGPVNDEIMDHRAGSTDKLDAPNPVFPGQDWAPCAHTDKARSDLGPWLAGVLGGVEGVPQPLRSLVKQSEKSALEHLLWTASDLELRSLSFSFASDMWVAVYVEYETHDGVKGQMHSYGDTFTLAMGRIVERLKDMKFPPYKRPGA